MPYFPEFDEFVDLAAKHNLVTIYRQISNDFLTPVGAFTNLREGRSRDAFLLESVEGGDTIARYSFLATEPFLRFEATRAQARVSRGVLRRHEDWNSAGEYVGSGSPLDALQTVLDLYRASRVPDIPSLCGGAVGYMSYDTIRYRESLVNAPLDDRDLPDIAFDFYGSVVIFDHVAKSIVITTNVQIPEHLNTKVKRSNVYDLHSAYSEACKRIDKIVGQMHRAKTPPIHDVNTSRVIYRGFDKSNFEREEFCAAVRMCKKYIVQGDIFQVVLSQRFETRTSADPFDIYLALRGLNPSPFMFYVRMGRTCLVGSSPELMVKVEDGVVTIRPLAGTRPRGNSDEEDQELEKELLADPKERAEHVMLVDLARNDVGRVAKMGSVRLEDVMCVERYSHVMHISSTVHGRLADDKTAIDAVLSGLPAGTVSGAPKIRAMEIIDELEPHRRGPYAGGVGFLDFTGNIETCLALRTLVCQGKKVYIQAGAGIVADSIPEREYQETINKAKGLLKAIEIAEEWRHPMPDKVPDVLSCIQPTADLHIGNYFGAVANWVKLQETHTCVYGIVDMHAITMPYDPAELRANSERMVTDLLACGIDPEETILFIQSLVPEHAELCWILSCQCSYGELGRMTQFKDKSSKLEADATGEFISAGLFTYPVLQAADILMYRAKYVPVGKDQEQHLELSRSIARRFNQRFGTEYFPEPQPLFTNTPKIMSLADPESKMSKSAGERHYVGLFEDESSIRKKVKSAVTDTGELERGVYMSPGVENLFEILRACGKETLADEMEEEYKNKSLKYVALKDAVADALVELTRGLRARREEIAADAESVHEKAKQMSEKAREIARETLRGVRELVGFPRGDD